MNRDIAIQVNNISKTFRIPHEKTSTLRGAAVNAFREKGYEEFNALDDVSFEVKKGEFFGIIGRNGSGKSTLLKILAGIYQPDKGKVKVNGLISPFLELGIGFNPELSGRDNVYLNATVLGLSKKEIDEKFDSIVAFSELERFIDQKLKNYSSGMQVRLAFSVSIHANREILLMDEVLAVGDSNFQSKCLTEFNKYKELGKTVILVTHDIATVQRYCDRAMLVRNGKIEKIGKAEEVGNEYMQQNMTDEERRLVQEETQKIIEEKAGVKKSAKEEKIIDENEKNKVAKIIDVEFLDKHGNKKNVFETGDDISAKIFFELLKPIDKINFGMTIVNQEKNISIIGVSTIIDNINTSAYVKQGFFQVDFKKILLRTNTYTINAAIFGENHQIVYDYLINIKTFKVFSKSQNDGLLEIDYKWRK